VEGDSASIAELLAILSDLSGVPLRQDVAVTGSVNQRGQTQAIGGVHHKVEGFYRTCLALGDGGRMQGVLVPATNTVNLVLHDDVAAAVEAGRFHIWAAETVEEALELFTGMAAGVPGPSGDYPAETLYGRVAAQLDAFDRILMQRRDPRSD
jgi:predicted ATP-dependent protease